jgi:hypothetical protein
MGSPPRSRTSELSSTYNRIAAQEKAALPDNELVCLAIVCSTFTQLPKIGLPQKSEKIAGRYR